MKLLLQDNDIETYSTHDEGKSVASERFIRILKDKILEFSIEKCVYWYISWYS